MTTPDAHALAEELAKGEDERQQDRTRAQRRFYSFHNPIPDSLACGCGWPGRAGGHEVFDTPVRWFVEWAMIHVPASYAQERKRRKLRRSIVITLVTDTICFLLLGWAISFNMTAAYGGWFKLAIFLMDLTLMMWLASRIIPDISMAQTLSPKRFWAQVSELADEVRESSKK